MYDPSLGRFIGMDAISEEFYHVTPYNYAENSPIANIDLWGLQAFNANMAASLSAVQAKYEAMASKGGNSLINLLVGNTRTDRIPSAVKANMSSQSQQMIDFSGKVSDAGSAAETPGLLLREVAYDSGEAMDQFGTALTYTGLALAPFTGGASLGLTWTGSILSSSGNGVQSLAALSEGEYGTSISKLSEAVFSLTTASGSKAAINASWKNGLITNGTEYAIQGTTLDAITAAMNEMFSKLVETDSKKENDEEDDKR